MQTSYLFKTPIGLLLSLTNVTLEFLILDLSPEPHIFSRTLLLSGLNLTQMCHPHMLQAELCPPKVHMLQFLCLAPQNVTLFGERVFKVVTTLE